jgi:hypothetical protein
MCDNSKRTAPSVFPLSPRPADEAMFSGHCVWSWRFTTPNRVGRNERPPTAKAFNHQHPSGTIVSSAVSGWSGTGGNLLAMLDDRVRDTIGRASLKRRRVNYSHAVGRCINVDLAWKYVETRLLQLTIARRTSWLGTQRGPQAFDLLLNLSDRQGIMKRQTYIRG